MSAGGLQVERLQEQMRGLKLPRTADELPTLLQRASKKELTYTDFLEEILRGELEARRERVTAMKTTMARFPFHKTLVTGVNYTGRSCCLTSDSYHVSNGESHLIYHRRRRAGLWESRVGGGGDFFTAQPGRGVRGEG